jgi:hypothetical protein
MDLFCAITARASRSCECNCSLSDVAISPAFGSREGRAARQWIAAALNTKPPESSPRSLALPGPIPPTASTNVRDKSTETGLDVAGSGEERWHRLEDGAGCDERNH